VEASDAGADRLRRTMVRLKRIVRFSINPAGSAGEESLRNGFGGKPAMRGLGRYYELEVGLGGQASEVTGYLVSVQDIDRLARETAVPLIARACETTPGVEPALLMPEILGAMTPRFEGFLRRVRWKLTPYYSVEMTVKEQDRVIIRQQFDFAAAHRLHSPELSDEENRKIFGHCNNPAGHGHNYRFEPAVAVRLEGGDLPFGLADLEAVADEVIVDRFDHKHLNEDTEAFATEGGVQPSVENIARVFYELLEPVIAERSAGAAELRGVTVWETDRTSCTYPGWGEIDSPGGHN
jgi:6-pyruvoyltetrahydropterin/6-carboxytetrahydropterin synthase